MSKNLYTVEWRCNHVLAPKSGFFLVKEKTPEKAMRKVFRKLLPWRDRRLMNLEFSPHGHGLIWLTNSAHYIGTLHITEE